jgi:hypothetical protein
MRNEADSRLGGYPGCLQDVVEDSGECFDAGQVGPGQGLQLVAPVVGELEMHPATVDGVTGTANQACCLCALGELDRAVMAYVQLLRDLADRWSRCGGVSAYDEQKLVKRGCQTAVVGALLAPA